MTYKDRFSAAARSADDPRKKLKADEIEEMLRIGEVTGQMPLVLSQLSKQFLDAPRPRRRLAGILVYPVLLVGLSLLSSMALPWLLERQGLRIDRVKSADAQAAPDDDGRLVLNATCIMGDKRLAIINGRTYRPNDTLVSSNTKAPPCVITDILPNKVLLECQGKRFQLCYVDSLTSPPGASPPTRSSPTQSPPPDLPPGLEGDGLTVLLEKMQKGEAGLTDVLPILSTLSRKKEKE
jgi:hypothetical protein